MDFEECATIPLMQQGEIYGIKSSVIDVDRGKDMTIYTDYNICVHACLSVWALFVCSHDFIGEFTTSYRELSRGQNQFNVYEVRHDMLSPHFFL